MRRRDNSPINEPKSKYIKILYFKNEIIKTIAAN